MSTTILVTCEHGGNRIPRPWRGHFSSNRARRALDSHRGRDLWALGVARAVAGRTDAGLVVSDVSRLLVDLNRSIGHPRLFSEFVHGIRDADRHRILDAHYRPYRDRVETAIREIVHAGGAALHLSIHSFTPVLDGKTRNADVGILYDPRRSSERAFATSLVPPLREGPFRVRRNYPYSGTADGLTTSLRRAFPDRVYRGIEIEMNQGTFAERMARVRLVRILCEVIEAYR